jgi:hypothetical protein
LVQSGSKYSTVDKQVNAVNYNAAVAALPGGDKITSRIWWIYNRIKLIFATLTLVLPAIITLNPPIKSYGFVLGGTIQRTFQLFLSAVRNVSRRGRYLRQN